MTKSAFKICLTFCALCTFAAPAIADTYRWVDDNGVVNYSEQKPRGIDESRLTVIEGSKKRRSQPSSQPTVATLPLPGGAQAPAVGSNGTPLNERQQDMMRELQAAEGDRQEQIAKIRQDNCERSRRVLANLSAKDRIRVRDENGRERVLPEDERQTKIQQAQDGIVEFCGA